MDKLIEDNLPVVLGIVIGFIFSLITGYFTRRDSLRDRKQEWQKTYRDKYLIEPVISYIDIILKQIQEAHDARLGGRPIKMLDGDNPFVFTQIRSRLMASNNKELLEDYDNLTTTYTKSIPAYYENQTDDVYQMLKYCEALAAKILNQLWQVRSD